MKQYNCNGSWLLQTYNKFIGSLIIIITIQHRFQGSNVLWYLKKPRTNEIIGTV